jgi:Peptidase family M28
MGRVRSATYYSRAIPPTLATAQHPKRRRRSAVDRPVNGRLYRMGWLVVALPLVTIAFTITRPAPLPNASATLQPVFDAAAARLVASDLAAVYPDRSPGSPASPGAASWVRDELAGLGIPTATDTFEETIPGRGRTTLRNVVGVVSGRSRDTIVVVAHRDSTPGTPGVNDNASGTGALVELARAYSATRGAAAGGVNPNHTLVFASTDGGAYGLLGARRLAQHPPNSGRVVAVVVLDAIGSNHRPRLELSGHGPRSPTPVFTATAAARIEDETGHSAGTPGTLAQVLDLAFPFSLYEQDAFLTEHISAVTITTEGSRPSAGVSIDRLNGARIGQAGRAAEGVIASLDALDLGRDTNSYVFANGRVIKGWTIAFLFIAMLVPVALANADLLARLRRRRIPLRPALRSYVRRLAFWLWVGAAFYLLALLGMWPTGAAGAVNPASAAATHWPRLGLAVLTIIVLVSWVIVRTRLVRRRPVEEEEEVAALTVAVTSTMLVAFVLIVTNPYALLFVLPSAHAWLWLIAARQRTAALQVALYVAGLIGPFLLLGSFAVRFGLGLDAPWYLAELTAVGYLPFVEVVLFLAWTAAAAQTLSVIAGRYGPYPAPEDRPARGPVGDGVAALRGARRAQPPVHK